MDQSQFQKLLEQMGDLDPAQFKTLVQAYAGKTGQSESRVWDGAVYATSEPPLGSTGPAPDVAPWRWYTTEPTRRVFKG